MDEREKDAEDKTEEATDERRKQYREEGRVANPREVVHSISLIILILSLYFLGKNLQFVFQQLFVHSWTSFRPELVTTSNLSSLMFRSIQPILPFILAISALLLLFPVLTGLLFTRFNWTWKKLTPDFANMNPISGIARMFSTKALPELFKSIVKIAVLGAIAYSIIENSIINASNNLYMELQVITSEVGIVIVKLLFSLGLAGLVIGLADWSYNWWQLEKQMRLTKEELKEEIKGQEGDPQVKNARRRMARDLVLSRAMEKVPKATFVVTNPDHYAVAILYHKGMNAPLVIAKGMDFLALKIKDIAKKSDIVMIENKPLARALYKTVKVGQEVPSSLYASIIEIMKYVRHLKGKDYFERMTVMGDRV